ncbi:bifunctional phosphoribosyl-AMP cyclohydrolase/phosphoribosyl-ATP diphosphatase HisIE [Rhodanobacter sp. L36]|uniref:bifunctional phosphoribosyl-AMP cyclohydrolase/phosphoribosyl-ATP diphosphatase HisIE n=1 Tax=Rhodanobacter sp. L36 TaxID=1747221 RepID=UPI0020B136C1|nr:bifunctional phosphoribosyl-AMP cyclohydrolase/phosphoribosyl-ATP diphosphatase HisIE [Rhodanobacter sp. L36]
MTNEKNVDTSRLDWAKGDGLLPVIVQHWQNGEVLMLGYMNAQALATTQATGHVTFFSRSKQRLWTKGESSGHLLVSRSIRVDCDADTLLVSAEPRGPTCHEGSTSCFGATVRPPLGFLAELDALVASRHGDMPQDSYTASLFEGGLRRMAQKVGEEGVETALAAVAQSDDELLGESSDLVFHLIVLLRARGLSLADVASVLAERHEKREAS